MRRPELLVLSGNYLFKNIGTFLLIIMVMVLLMNCVDKFIRSNVIFPLTSVLLSSLSIVLLLPHFIFTATYSDRREPVIAAVTFMSLRILLLADSSFLLKKYFRVNKSKCKTRNGLGGTTDESKDETTSNN